MIQATRPRSYGSFADFERDELRPMQKLGFCVDDLESEATFTPAREESAGRDPEELEFG